MVLVNLISTGSVDQPRLTAEFKSDTALSAKEKTEALATINSVLNLDLDILPFYECTRSDPIMNQIVQRLRGLKSPTTQTVFEALVDSIVEQQISIKVAFQIESKLTRKFGDALNLDGEVYFGYPKPQTLALASIDEMRSCGLSQRKAEYIKNASSLLSKNILNLDSLKIQPPEQIIAELDKLKGIGVWTAELTMLRGMKKFEAFPADDFGIRRVISTYYRNGKTITSAEARDVAKAWGDWKGLAAFYLIVAETQGIKL